MRSGPKELSEPHRGTITDRPTAHEPCHLSFGERAGLRQATIGNGLLRAEILLDKGANVRQLWHVPSSARALAESPDWCEGLAEFHRGGRRGQSYSDFYEGGWQDVLPARAQWDGGAVGDRDGAGVGEAAIVPWDVTRWVSTAASARLVCRCRLPRSGLEVVKRFTVRARDAALRVHTTVSNATAGDVRFSWTQHPALGGDLLDETSRVWLPGGRPRASRDHDRRPFDHTGDGHGSGRAADPAASGGIAADALLPAPGGPDRFTTFANVDRGEAALASRARGLGVRLRWCTSTLPHVWLWCARREGITCVAVEPSNTYLPEMMPRRENEILHLLRPGESVRTWVELALFALDREPRREAAVGHA